MAKLHLIALEDGEKLSTWFNGTSMTSTKQFDVSDWAESAHANDPTYKIQTYENLWTVKKNKIRFDNGRIWAQWGGKYEISGDTIAEGYVTSFERYWGDGPTGRIKITNFRYPAISCKTAGAFESLTLPEAITDHFDSTAYTDQNGYEIPVYDSDEIRSLKPGMTYTFETVYDNYRQKSGDNKSEDTDRDPITKIDAPTKFKIKNIDKITNFNPTIDTLEIDADSFGIDSSATFTAGKNKKHSRRNSPNKTLTSSMTRRKVGSTSMKTAQRKALAMVAYLPS